MANDNNTASDASSATQGASTPATGTPASSGATPETKPALTVEELLKRNAELEHSQKNATEEVERHRKKLSAYEKAEKETEAAKKAAEEAQLSEIERVKKQSADLEQKIKHYQEQLVMAQVKLAAKDKGIIDADLAALAIQGKLELDADGMPTNVEKSLDDLIKSKPYLAPKPAEPAQTSATPATSAPTPNAPAVPPMNPGRAAIQSPTTNPPGKITIPDWNQVYKRP